jgi:eukaryotic-like serine/threonine-protein kinase
MRLEMATPAQALPDGSRRLSRAGGVEDRYRSLFVVGRGGMGSVEVALERGAGDFERVVALKRLLPEQARDPRHKQMFLREARLAALLRHPNVVHAFAFGELYGELFLAMEYVEGETLSRALTVGQVGIGLDAVTVAFVLAEVCDGLHAAHELRDEHGQPLHVVHRDVSPHNVMIAYDGHVKILDFGVAKFDTSGQETRTGEVKGKMAYMSPEQALGEKLDRRSDLYSVGAVLFECITGQRMWGPGTDLEVMRRLALEDPPHVDSVMPDAPKALVDLHARLVERDVDRRPATAREVARELRAYATKWPAANAASVATMMQRLFATEIETRRAELNAALEAAAPARVQELRKTLDLETGFEHATLTEPVMLRSESPPSGPQSRRWRGVAGGAVMLALGAGIVAVAIARSSHSAHAPEATAAAAGTTTATTAASVPTALSSTSSVALAADSTALPTASVAPSSISPRAASTKPPTVTPPHGRPARPSPAAAPTGNRPPDVDPTPF